MQRILLILCLLMTICRAGAADAPREYTLAAGDVIRVTVYQNPDLTTSSRVTENGFVSLPLLGAVKLGGLSILEAEALLAKRLSDGGFVRQPQVTILLQDIRGNQISVLGHVNRPGRYALETTTIRSTDALAMAGGVAETGGESIVVTGVRDNKPFRYEVDIPSLYESAADRSKDMVLMGGDSLYVNRAPVFFIYGEVQKPGAFRLARDMTLMQAVATGGGVTQRGTLNGIQVSRHNASGKPAVMELGMDARLQPNDVVFVKQSLF